MTSDLNSAMPSCATCRLYEQCRTPGIPGFGSSQAILLLVGQNPGAIEDIQGKPFVGDAGIILKELLARAGIPENLVWYTNAVRCKTIGDREPTKAEIRACRPALLAEIAEVKPKAVVLLGNTALDSVFDRVGITKARGRTLMHSDFPNTYFVPTFHPAKLLREWEDTYTLIDDFKLAWQLAMSKLPEKEVKQVEYTNIHDLPALKAALEELQQALMISFDIETSGFNFQDDEVLCLSMSHEVGKAYVIPFLGQNCSPLWSDEDLKQVISSIKAFLEQTTPPKVGQNFKFDCLFLKHRLGIEVKGLMFDTLLAHALIDENQPHDLDFLVGAYTDMPSYHEEFHKRVGKASFASVPAEELWSYSAADSDAELRVALKLIPLIRDQGLRGLYATMMKSSDVLMRVQECGMKVDLENVERIQQLMQEHASKLTSEIHVLAGEVFDIGSHTKLSAVLEKMRIVSPKRTKTGGPCWDKEVLEQLTARYPITGKILELRKINKRMGTYVKGKEGGKSKGISKFLYRDGRVHPSFNIHGTRTGRLSCSNPPQHSIPKDSEIRNMYIAGKGYLFVEADYSAFEAAIQGVIYHEKVILEAMKERVRIHDRVCMELFGKEPQDITDREEMLEKAIFFGLTFGKGVYGLASDLNIPLEEAERYVEKFFARMPNVQRGIMSTKEEVRRTGQVINPFGRVRHLWGIHELSDERLARLGLSASSVERLGQQRAHIEREAVNFKIQSTGADILHRVTGKVSDALDGSDTHIVLSLHDALFFEVPEMSRSRAAELVSIIQREMEAPFTELDGWGFNVSMSVGRYWGDDSLTADYTTQTPTDRSSIP